MATMHDDDGNHYDDDEHDGDDVTMTIFMTMMYIVVSRVVRGTRRVKRTIYTAIQSGSPRRGRTSGSICRAHFYRNTHRCTRNRCTGTSRRDQNLSWRSIFGSRCGYLPASLSITAHASTAVVDPTSYNRNLSGTFGRYNPTSRTRSIGSICRYQHLPSSYLVLTSPVIQGSCACLVQPGCPG